MIYDVLNIAIAQTIAQKESTEVGHELFTGKFKSTVLHRLKTFNNVSTANRNEPNTPMTVEH